MEATTSSCIGLVNMFAILACFSRQVKTVDPCMLLFIGLLSFLDRWIVYLFSSFTHPAGESRGKGGFVWKTRDPNRAIRPTLAFEVKRDSTEGEPSMHPAHTNRLHTRLVQGSTHQWLVTESRAIDRGSGSEAFEVRGEASAAGRPCPCLGTSRRRPSP